MSSEPPQPPPTLAPDDPRFQLLDDLYCLECGYNLRGLSGDPRRCPECFYMNPVGEAELSAEIISRQLRRMETAPALCVGSVIFGAAGLIPLASAAGAGGGPAVEEALFCCGIPVVGAVIIWIASMAEFVLSCAGASAWFGALMRYHLYGLSMALIVIGAVVGSAWALLSTVWFGWEFAGGMLIVGVLVVWTVIRFARWGHRRAKRAIEPLQGEAAVRLARERIRRELSWPH